MIERYARPEMANLWSETHKMGIWQHIQTLAAQAQAQLGNIPQQAAENIAHRASSSPGSMGRRIISAIAVFACAVLGNAACL